MRALRVLGLVLVLWVVACGGRSDPASGDGEPPGGPEPDYLDLAQRAWIDRDRGGGESDLEQAVDALTETALSFEFTDDAGRSKWKGSVGLPLVGVDAEGLRVDVGEGLARLHRYLRRFEAREASQLRVRMRVSGSGEVTCRWRPLGESRFVQGTGTSFEVAPSDELREYRVGLGAGTDRHERGRKEWTGTIDALALDFSAGVDEAWIQRIDLIRRPGRNRVLAERLRRGLDDHAIVAGESRRVLPVSGATLELAVPTHATLRAYLSVVPGAEGDDDRRQPSWFRVRFVDEDGASIELGRRRLPSEARPAAVGWSRWEVDLGSVGGRSGVLHLESGREGEPEPDWGVWSGGVWGSPRIVRPSEKVPDRSNVLLISIDTLRADRLGSYGNPRPSSPHLDALLARRGVQFERAFTPAPWTLPAHVSLFTAQDPIRHGVETGAERLGAAATTLAERLKEEGYRTLAVTSGANLAPEWGFDQGFDVYGVVLGIEGGLERTVALLEELDGEPFFLFFHTVEPHSTYHPEEPWFPLFEEQPYEGDLRGTRQDVMRVNRWRIPLDGADVGHLNRLYDSEVAETDQGLALLLGHLDRLGFLERTVVVLVSDHGEEFYEHRGLGHGRSLYEELLRVPLLVRGAGSSLGPDLRSEAVSLVDVHPTLLDLVGVELPPDSELDGRSLVPALRGLELDRGPVVASVNHEHYGDPKLAITDGDRALIVHPRSGEEEVYRLSDDPGELRPAGAADDLRRELERRMAERWGRVAPADTGRDLRPETVDQLRELGYIE